jgi:glycosyltransferase involved in cell wall biosynthesis
MFAFYSNRLGCAGSIIVSLIGSALVDADDHELLAETLARAIDEGWKFRKGPAARRRAERELSLEASVERHVKIYESVLIQRFGSLDHL